MWRFSRTWCWRRRTRRCGWRRRWRRASWAARQRAWTWAALVAAWACRACETVSTSYAPPVQRLVMELSKLPGIGNRTAQRLAFHILRASEEDALGLADAIRDVKEKIGLCEICFNLTDEARCRICT